MLTNLFGQFIRPNRNCLYWIFWVSPVILLFAECIKCKSKTSVQEGIVVFCWSKPRLLSPSKQGPCQTQVSSSTVVFAVMRVNQIDLYISIVWPFPSSYSAVPGGQISCKPTQIYMFCTQILLDVTACVSTCMFTRKSAWIVSVLSVLAVTAGFWWWRLIFCGFWKPLSLNTLSCRLKTDGLRWTINHPFTWLACCSGLNTPQSPLLQ